jgi:hypothetical protein
MPHRCLASPLLPAPAGTSNHQWAENEKELRGCRICLAHGLVGAESEEELPRLIPATSSYRRPLLCSAPSSTSPYFSTTPAPTSKGAAGPHLCSASSRGQRRRGGPGHHEGGEARRGCTGSERGSTSRCKEGVEHRGGHLPWCPRLPQCRPGRTGKGEGPAGTKCHWERAPHPAAHTSCWRQRPRCTREREREGERDMCRWEGADGEKRGIE